MSTDPKFFFDENKTKTGKSGVRYEKGDEKKRI